MNKVTRRQPAFWLTRCPRCLAPLPEPVKTTRGLEVDRFGGASCYRCLDMSAEKARAEYERRLAQGHVVKKVAEYAKAREHGMVR